MVYCLSDGKNGIHRFYNKPEGSVRIGEFGRLPLADKFTVKTCRCKRKEKRNWNCANRLERGHLCLKRDKVPAEPRLHLREAASV